ncbi:hypothetical protein [Alsobacter metallidurans]|uniref:hypothetical protein n=1 Tax=Alsobacter metallidurans TaxID=340221 RepID=UPI00166D89A9|nr:hypothetical protein [Alsobacter metallidurans]
MSFQSAVVVMMKRPSAWAPMRQAATAVMPVPSSKAKTVRSIARADQRLSILRTRIILQLQAVDVKERAASRRDRGEARAELSRKVILDE